MNMQTSLTQGNIYSTMIKFAIPFLFSSLLQALYGAADMLIVGHFSSSAGLSAVATGSQIMMAITCLITGLTTGGTVLIGQYVGAGRRRDVIETIGTMFTLFALVAVGLTAVLLLTVDPVMAAMHAPPEALGQTRAYVVICASGVVFIFGYNAISAILRGLGDSKSPLVFVAIACVCNIVGDLALVGGLGMGAAGAAAATCGSQGISMLLAILYLKRKKDFIFDFRLSRFRMSAAKVRRLLKLGLPISMQDTVVTVSFLFITALANKMGVAASAAVGITEKITTFTMLPPMAFSSAIAVIAAQNIGAGRPDRAQKSLRTGVLLSLVFGTLCTLWMTFAPDQVIRLFSADPEVLRVGAPYVQAVSPDCLLVCFIFCFNGFFNGCGRTVFSMMNNLLATFLVRVPLAFVFSSFAGATLFYIGAATPLASVFSVVLGLVYLRMGKWKRMEIA